LLMLSLLSVWASPSSALTLTNLPVADAFVRAAAPTSNYGGAGSLSVSGSAAANQLGQQNGLFDTLMRFSLGATMASFDTALGAGNWTLTGATLKLTEQAAPNNLIFNRGTGSFEIRWINNDSWIEGTGNPNTPTTDGVVYDDLASLLNGLTDVSLGTFANAGLNAQQSFVLPLSHASFLNDLLNGNEVSLYLTAISPEIGFTFNSRSAGAVSSRPFLELTAVAVPEPAAGGLTLLGIVLLASCRFRNRREHRLN